MADLGKTQLQWTDFTREFTQYMNPYRLVLQSFLRVKRARTLILEQFEETGASNLLTNWSLTGAKRGVNLTESGQLFVDVDDETPGVGQAQVQLYKDSAKGAPDLVAQGDSADSSTVTLAEQNSSGLSGTVDIGVIAANITDVVLSLQIDEKLKADAVFSADTLGITAKGKFISLMVTAEGRLSALLSTIKSDIESNFILTKMADFIKTTTTTIISSAEADDANGDTVVTYTGILQEFLDAMEDETTAGAQSVLPNTVTPGSPAYDPDNSGVGVLSVVSSEEHAPSGVLEFVCTSGSADTLSELFSVNLISDTGGVIASGTELEISKNWESALLGVRLLLSRTITDVNDGSAQVDTYIVNGETLTNTDGGKLYQDLTNVTTTRTLTWYNNSARGTADKVAEGSRTGDGVVTMLALNASGLTGSANVTYTGDDVDMEVLLNPFLEGDKITMTLVNDEAGIFQTLMRTIWSFSLPSNASPTLPDDLIKEGADNIIAES